MTNSRSLAIQYAHNNAPHFLEELIDFCTIASISTDEFIKT